MSQEKVNRYKEEKANRKKMLRRQKVMNRSVMTVALLYITSVFCIKDITFIISRIISNHKNKK